MIAIDSFRRTVGQVLTWRTSPLDILIYFIVFQELEFIPFALTVVLTLLFWGRGTVVTARWVSPRVQDIVFAVVLTGVVEAIRSSELTSWYSHSDNPYTGVVYLLVNILALVRSLFIGRAIMWFLNRRAQKRKGESTPPRGE